MLKNFDVHAGRVRDHLKKRGLEKNPLFVFLSDNGGCIGVDKLSLNQDAGDEQL